MKSKLLGCILAIMFLPTLCFGADGMYVKDYNLSISNSVTGNTTVATSGVSSMMLNGGTGTVIELKDDTPYLAFQITGVSPSQAAIKSQYSGATFYVSYQSAMRDIDIAKQEKIPVFAPIALSGVTTIMHYITLPYARKVSFNFHTTAGNSPFDGASAMVFVGGKDAGWKPAKAVHIRTLVYNITATTGTSAFTGEDSNALAVPDGTRYMVAQNSPTSGVSVLYSQGGGTIANATASYIDASDRMVWEGSLQTLKNISIKALGTTYLIVECWTAKPY